jgi:hypothetical protein
MCENEGVKTYPDCICKTGYYYSEYTGYTAHCLVKKSCLHNCYGITLDIANGLGAAAQACDCQPN